MNNLGNSISLATFLGSICYLLCVQTFALIIKYFIRSVIFSWEIFKLNCRRKICDRNDMVTLFNFRIGGIRRNLSFAQFNTFVIFLNVHIFNGYFSEFLK